MAGLDVTETGNELSQPKFEFTSLLKTEWKSFIVPVMPLANRILYTLRNQMTFFLFYVFRLKFTCSSTATLFPYPVADIVVARKVI